MSDSIVGDLQELIAYSKINKQHAQVNEFEEGIKMLKKLQAVGLVKPHENRLMDPEERLKRRTTFNQTEQPFFY